MLAFIELVLKYDGADFEHWPGYARCRVHFALFNAMEKQGRIWENESQVDTESETGTGLIDDCRADGGGPDELEQLMLSLELQEALGQLNAMQQQVLQLLFLEDLKPAEAAQRLGCTVRNVTKHRLKGLDNLRTILNR